MKKIIIVASIILFSASIALAGQTFNPHTGQWERSGQPQQQPKPDTNIGPGGAIDSKTGTHFAPQGPHRNSGVTNTRDGTVWNRSGDMLINSRTGETVYAPRQKKDDKERRKRQR